MPPTRVVLVVSARPNFVKVAPILSLMTKYSNEYEPIFVHTGQHYDVSMAEIIFEDLGLPAPDYNLKIGSGTHGSTTGRVMIEFERVLFDVCPDLVVVFGDVNPTVACAIDAAKLGIPVAHIEAGLRSGSRQMPEELNRILTDAVSSFLFTPSPDADKNLVNEGIDESRIYRVGNVMIDTLRRMERYLDRSNVLNRHGLEEKGYALLTLHRPSNVDDADVLMRILDAIDTIQEEITVVFPMHPRTRKQFSVFGYDKLIQKMHNIKTMDPTSYLDSLMLQKAARMVLTDSGGIQEETTAFGIPCLTLRENTERPITITQGSNTLVGVDTESIIEVALKVLVESQSFCRVPDLWDGFASNRILRVFNERLRR